MLTGDPAGPVDAGGAATHMLVIPRSGGTCAAARHRRADNAARPCRPGVDSHQARRYRGRARHRPQPGRPGAGADSAGQGGAGVGRRRVRPRDGHRARQDAQTVRQGDRQLRGRATAHRAVPDRSPVGQSDFSRTPFRPSSMDGTARCWPPRSPSLTSPPSRRKCNSAPTTRWPPSATSTNTPRRGCSGGCTATSPCSPRSNWPKGPSAMCSWKPNLACPPRIWARTGEAFRAEYLQFIAEHGARDKAPTPMNVDRRHHPRHGATRAGSGFGWPAEYGGRDASLAEQVVLNEETTYNRVGATKALGIRDAARLVDLEARQRGTEGRSFYRSSVPAR